MSRDTLTAMAHGGLYDQVGGGFCRYSVDERWEIPHFEKMLYDNARTRCARSQGPASREGSSSACASRVPWPSSHRSC